MTQDAKYGGLKLTGKAYDVFKGREIVLGILEKDHLEHRKGKGKGKETEYEYDRVLFEKLRKERKELADKASLPPYVIFSDKTLIEMAALFPRSGESLLHIYGVGSVKSKKYGTIFLDIIDGYCRDHHK